MQGELNKLKKIRKTIAEKICTEEHYVFSTKAPRKKPTHYFQLELKKGSFLLGRIRDKTSYGTKISIYAEGTRRFVRPGDVKEVDAIWDNYRKREVFLKNILKGKAAAYTSCTPQGGDQVVAVARAGRFRSLGRIFKLGDSCPLKNKALKALVAKHHKENEIAVYL